MKGKITPFLIVGLIIAAFVIGSQWTKIKTLEGGKTGGEKIATTTPQPNNAGTGEAASKVEVAINSDDPVKGNPEAKVTIVEFSDFQCPACGAAEPSVRKILEEYQDQIRLVYKDFPLSFHENAEPAALAALCAKEQGKFWEYHDLLFENQESLTSADLKKYATDLGLKTQEFSSCFDSKKYKDQVSEDKNEATRLSVGGTPTFFVNGRLVGWNSQTEGWFNALKRSIDEELK